MNEKQKNKEEFNKSEDMKNPAYQYLEEDQVIEISKKKHDIHTKKQINIAEAQTVYKCLKQPKDQITQQNYQDCAYILTKLPIFSYVYSIKGLTFITEFLKTGQLMDIHENNYVLFDKDGSYIQRFFLLLKGSVFMEGQLRKSHQKKSFDKISQSQQNEVQMNQINNLGNTSNAPFLTQLEDLINSQQVDKQNIKKKSSDTEMSDELYTEFNDSGSTFFRLDSLDTISDCDLNDSKSMISDDSVSKRSKLSTPRYSSFYELQDQNQNTKTKMSNFALTSKSQFDRKSQLYKSEHTLSQYQSDYKKAQQLVSQSSNENNYVIQVVKPDTCTPHHNDENIGEFNTAIKPMTQNIELEIPQESLNFIQNNSIRKDSLASIKGDDDFEINMGQNLKIQSQRIISIPTENKARSRSYIPKKDTQTNIQNKSRKPSNNLNLSVGSKKNLDSQRQSSQHIHQQLNDVSSFRRKSNLMLSNKLIQNNSVSYFHDEQILTNRSHKSVRKSSYDKRSKKSKIKKKKIVLIEKFRTINSINVFGHKFKVGKYKMCRILTASEKNVLLSFTMKDFEELIYGIDESNGEIKQIRNIINTQQLFKTCSFRQINNLTFMSKRITFYKNDVIYSQDDKSKGLYFILSGEVKILIDSLDENQTQDFYQEGNQSPILQSSNAHSPNQQSKNKYSPKKDRFTINKNAQGETHELFIHKNKNKLKCEQYKFTNKHQREVGLLGDGGFFGLEDLVLGLMRSSTIEVVSRELQVLYIPLDNKDIFIYLDDESKQELCNSATQQIQQRRKRAACNISSLSKGLSLFMNNIGPNNILNLTKNFYNSNLSYKNSKNNTSSNFYSKQNENQITNDYSPTKISHSPSKTSHSPTKNNNSPTKINISPPKNNGQSKVQPILSNISNNQKVIIQQANNLNSEIKCPNSYSKVAKINDKLIRYPTPPKITIPNNDQLQGNNIFTLYGSNPTNFEKMFHSKQTDKQQNNQKKQITIDNQQETNESIQKKAEIYKEISVLKDQSPQLQKRELSNKKINVQNPEFKIQILSEQGKESSPSKDLLEISDLIKCKEIKKQRFENNTKDISPTNSQTPNQKQIPSEQQKVGDLITYYNQKKLEDAKSAIRRSFSCKMDGEKAEQETFQSQNQGNERQTTEEKRSAATLDIQDMQKENIIWKKDIIMTNTEFSPLNVKQDQKQQNIKQNDLQIPLGINNNSQFGQSQLLQQSFINKKLKSNKDLQVQNQVPQISAYFSNDFINKNVNTNQINPQVFKNQVENMFYYPNLKTYQRENNITPSQYTQNEAITTKNRVISSSHGQRNIINTQNRKQNNLSINNTTKNNTGLQQNQHKIISFSNTVDILQLNERSKSKNNTKDEQNQFLQIPNQSKQTADKNNKQNSKRQSKSSSKNPTRNASLQNLDQEQMNQTLKQQNSFSQLDFNKIIKGKNITQRTSSTAQSGQRQKYTHNSIFLTDEKSIRIQNKNGKNRSQLYPTFCKQERSQTANSNVRIKQTSKSSQRQYKENMTDQQNIGQLNNTETQFNRESQILSGMSPKQNERRLLDHDKRYNSENYRVKRNNTTISCFNIKSDNYNYATNPNIIKTQNRPVSRNENLDFSGNFECVFDENTISELKIKQEIDSMIVNPKFKLSNNFHFYQNYQEEQDGLIELDENIEQQVDIKKNILEHINSYTNKTTKPQADYKKSYVKKYIYPEDAFAREADQKIKIQQEKYKQEEGNQQNPYLQNTKFEENDYSSFMIFDEYKKKKLKYFHRNKNLYSRCNISDSKPEEQTPIRALYVQNSAAVKNNKRKLKNSRKSQIQQAQQDFIIQNIHEQDIQSKQNNNQTNKIIDINNINSNSNHNKSLIVDNQSYPDELSQINQKFTKVFHENDGYFTQFKNKSELKQRQKDILNQFQNSKSDQKQFKHLNISQNQTLYP